MTFTAATAADFQHLGRLMARLADLVDADTYQMLQADIVADADKDANGVFTEQGIREVIHGYDVAVQEFETDGYDDSIERAERAVGA
jgi:hypothetical protein